MRRALMGGGVRSCAAGGRLQRPEPPVAQSPVGKVESAPTAPTHADRKLQPSMAAACSPPTNPRMPGNG